jgi:hypothetical protein
MSLRGIFKSDKKYTIAEEKKAFEEAIAADFT